MYDPRDDSPKQGVAAAKDAAPKLGIALIERRTRSSEEIIQALKALSDADAFLAIPAASPRRIIKRSSRRQTPSGSPPYSTRARKHTRCLGDLRR